MITVKPYHNTWNTGYVVEGHAEYAERGQDIVCASVSALAQTTLLGLKRYTQVHYVVKDGYIRVQIAKQDSREILAIMSTFVRGIEAIANQYNQNVELREGNLQ